MCSQYTWHPANYRRSYLQLRREYQIKYLLSLSFFIKSFLGGFESTIPWFGERREDEGVGTSQSILEARQTHPLLLLKVKMHKMIWQHHMHLRCPKRLLQGRKATELPYVYSKLVYYPLCCVKNYDFKISVSWTMLFHELCLQIPGSGVQFLV